MNNPVNTIFDSETGITVLKWAITILIAGFIAQFGKKFATFLIVKIQRFKNRKSASPPPQAPAHDQQSPAPGISMPSQVTERIETRRAELKLNKKMLKAQAKERKKK